MQNQVITISDHLIRDIICKCYDKLYVGKIKITELHPGYDVALYLNTDYLPIHIAANMDIQDYLKYFEQEIRKRHLSHDHYYTGYKSDILEPHEMRPDIKYK